MAVILDMAAILEKNIKMEKQIMIRASLTQLFLKVWTITMVFFTWPYAAGLTGDILGWKYA